MEASIVLDLQSDCLFDIEDYYQMFEILTEREDFFDWVYDYMDENPKDKRVIKFINDIS